MRFLPFAPFDFNWLFSEQNSSSTVIAHNGSGYDYKFILKNAIEAGKYPDKYIRQGSNITYMTFKQFNLRFVDSLNFFQESLKKLSKSYDIDTVKGDFPHHFNTPENQNYIGPIPEAEMFGDYNMVNTADNPYYDDFHKWYKNQQDITNWSFKDEMKRYCEADVELLAKAVLKFRKMFKESHDVDPFRSVTFPSLVSQICKNKFLPEKTIVANATEKNISTISREWFIHQKNEDIKIEHLLYVKNEGFESSKNYKSPQHQFTVDGLDKKLNLVKEFNGCYWHGCPRCYPDLKERYQKTQERKKIIEQNGFEVEEMWECDWNKIKNELKPEIKEELEQEAKDQCITIRDALFGGRTEAFKTYHKCNEDEKIFYYDVVSLYPTVNALDEYAVGFKKNVKMTLDDLDDIRSGKFVGLLKVDITPPKDLYVPVLPDNSNGKLMFHLNPMVSKTWSSIELKKALEKGYEITRIYSAYKYEPYTGLMKDFVGSFLKMKIENNKHLSEVECEDLNKSLKNIGLNFKVCSEDTKKNPGLKSVAKLCLNSLWGKFGQRSNLPSYEYINDYNAMVQKACDPTTNLKSWTIVNEKCVEMKFEEESDYVVDAPHISEITAIFTTANARMRLYSMLDWLHHSQICYCDTDSVMFIYNKNNPLHKKPENDQEGMPSNIRFGNSLGEWEYEMKDPEEYIEELVIGGAKCYSYLTNKGKIEVKTKGVTLDITNAKLVNLESLRAMVLEDARITTADRYQFRDNHQNKTIETRYSNKSIRCTVGEKRMIIGTDTFPLGFKL